MIPEKRKPQFDHMGDCLMVDRYLSIHKEWKKGPNLSLTQFFIATVKEKSQAICKKLVDFTHLKNRPEEWVGHIKSESNKYGSPLIHSFSNVIEAEPLREFKLEEIVHSALLEFRGMYNENKRNPNPDKLEADIQSISISLKDVQAAYERIKSGYYLSSLQYPETVIRNISSELDSKSRDPDKLLVTLYLCKNKVGLKKHLLEDEGIRALCKYYTGESKPLDAVNLYEVLSLNKDIDDKRIKSRRDLTREAVHRFIEPNYQSDPKLIAEAVGRCVGRFIEPKIKRSDFIPSVEKVREEYPDPKFSSMYDLR